MHKMTANERLQVQVQMLVAQNNQLRMTMGCLVHKMGNSATVTVDDLQAMKDAQLSFMMTARPGEKLPDGTQGPDTIELKVLTPEEMKALQDAAPKVEAPPAPSLIIPG